MAFDYIPLWDRYKALFEAMEDDEIGRLVRAMQDYKDGKEPKIVGNERFIWPSVRNDIDSARASYEETCRKQRENGAKGGRPKKADGFEENPKNPEVFSETQKSKYKAKQSNTKQINTDSPNGECEKTRVKRFTPPTLAEVQAYVSERQSPVDPQGFIDFYASKGWMVGKAPMKDWKAACRNAEGWERWHKEDSQKGRQPNYQPTSDRIARNSQRLKQLLEEEKRTGYQPTPERIKKNNEWLDNFLAEQQKEA